MRSIREGFVMALALGVTSCGAGSAWAQTTVPFTSPGWGDFGTTTTAPATGNFLPGWSALTGTPDVGNNVFFIPTQSLSGMANDAGLWMLKFDQTSPSFPANESAELSLSGFSAGQQYRLDFNATLVLSTYAGWNSTLDDLQVSLVGADISTFTTSLLSDAGNHDGVNAWVPQTILFTAMGPVVNFRFNEFPTSVNPALVGRIGIDGMSVAPVPAPATGCVLGVLLLGAARRQRGWR